MLGRMMVALAAACVAGAGCERDGAGEPEVVQEVEAPSLDPELAALLPTGVSAEAAAEGRDLYPQCGVCHGMEGEGTQLGPPLRDGEWRQGSGQVDEIAGIIRGGVGSPEGFPVPMPAYGQADFSDEQVRSIAAYVFVLSRRGSRTD